MNKVFTKKKMILLPWDKQKEIRLNYLKMDEVFNSKGGEK